MEREGERIYVIEWELENYNYVDHHDRWHNRIAIRDSDDHTDGDRSAALYWVVDKELREGRLVLHMVGPVDDEAPMVVRSAAEREGARIAATESEMVIIHNPRWGSLIPSGAKPGDSEE